MKNNWDLHRSKISDRNKSHRNFIIILEKIKGERGMKKLFTWVLVVVFITGMILINVGCKDETTEEEVSESTETETTEDSEDTKEAPAEETVETTEDSEDTEDNSDSDDDSE